jgi:t-SNARE complex subunit (syntaxin)
VISGRKKSRDIEEGIKMEKEESDMNPFFEKVDWLRQLLLKLRKNVDEISGLHSKTLTAISEREEQQLRQNLDSFMTETSLLVVEVRNDLKSKHHFFFFKTEEFFFFLS